MEAQEAGGGGLHAPEEDRLMEENTGVEARPGRMKEGRKERKGLSNVHNLNRFIEEVIAFH